MPVPQFYMVVKRWTTAYLTLGINICLFDKNSTNRTLHEMVLICSYSDGTHSSCSNVVIMPALDSQVGIQQMQTKC